jgi:hypothetical protein
MPISIPSMPDYSVAPPQVASPLEQYGKMLQLKALSGQVQQQQQMAPLQQQEAQNTVQSQQIELQQKQLALKTQQAQNTYWSNPSQFQADAPAGGDQLAKTLGISDDDPLLGMVRGQIKAGVPGAAAIADAKATLSFRQEASKTTEDQQKVLDDSHSKIQQILAPVLAEKDPTKKAALLEQIRPGLAQAAGFDPTLKPIIPQLSAQNIDAFGNRLGAEQGAIDLQSKSADLWKKELENQQSVDPLLKMQTNPTEAFSGDKLPASIAYLTTKLKDPDPKVSTMATQLLGVANTSKNVQLQIDQAKKSAEQAIADGDPNAAAQLLVNGTVAPSQLISSRKPEFAQKAFTAAAQLQQGWSAQKAEGDFKVASGAGNVAFFGSAKSLTDPGGTLDQLKAAAKDIPQGQIPVFNSMADLLKAQTGSGPIARYAATLVGVADDYAKVTGGGAGTEGMQKFVMGLVPANASPEQRDGALEGFRGSINSQVTSRIGNNGVMQQMYGTPKPAAAAAVKTLSTSAIEQAAKDHGLTVDQVKAQAKAAGYTIQ